MQSDKIFAIREAERLEKERKVREAQERIEQERIKKEKEMQLRREKELERHRLEMEKKAKSEALKKKIAESKQKKREDDLAAAAAIKANLKKTANDSRSKFSKRRLRNSSSPCHESRERLDTVHCILIFIDL